MDYKQAYEKFTADAKKSQDIKVGDKVRYTGPSEWDLTQGKVYQVSYVGVSFFDVLDDAGEENALVAGSYEPVAPDYNNGEWHGWNGGERPVHPESEVQWSRFCLGESGVAYQGACNAKHGKWDTITSFRVTKPYVEPKKPREFWLCRDAGEDFIVARIYPSAVWGEVIHVREVLDD